MQGPYICGPCKAAQIKAYNKPSGVPPWINATKPHWLTCLSGWRRRGGPCSPCPEAAAIQEVSLTVLALVGYLLLAGEAKLPIVFGAAGLVLELILSGAQSGGAWVWLEPALRAVDLWLFWGAALVLLRLCGKAASKMPLVAAVPLAVYTVAHFLPPAATVAAVAFVAFSVVMLWFAASMIRAYNDVRVKK